VAKRSPDEAKLRKETWNPQEPARSTWAVETFDALVSERGDSGKIWGSMLKESNQAPQA